MRTLLTLDIAGLINLYENSFDLSKYRAQRDRYIETILPKTDTLTREILEYAERECFGVPKKAYAMAWAKNPKRMLKRSLWSACRRRMT